MSAELDVLGVGRMAYGDALELQRALARARIDKTLERDVLMLVEHPPVVTLGRSTQREHLLTPEAQLRARGIELFDIERGGDVTFHGPGQLVGYPIYDLAEHKKDLHHFLRQLEAALIRALDHLGITGERRDTLTGVWVEDRKIASIGIHVKKWVTWHGFALNVLTDLSYFDLIVPCGIAGVQMTNVQRELGAQAPRDLWGLTCDYVTMEMTEVFGQRPQPIALKDVMARL
jgi:lipoyl(octanoyl) transferase